MNSISRAITSRFNDISNKRHRLVAETKDADIVNSGWEFPTTSDFNSYDPPELIIEEEDLKEIAPMSKDRKSDNTGNNLDMRIPNNISKKVTSVVRRLSPFGCSNNLTAEKVEEKFDGIEEKKTQKMFKETREKVDRIKKSFKTNERQQLIDSDEEQ
ncbi:hypothetical protein OESDEN_07511 [Oesophagostomum dentatum]|uniref:Uncharacterized protein n=1 Tax=Oesophagostomum dentatum TaxID=61180 RepID=A0A0B1T9X3_OESDE|nr:hypothetical protein OESDEN_07511 [Oesophagostomum dentatum]